MVQFIKNIKGQIREIQIPNLAFFMAVLLVVFPHFLAAQCKYETGANGRQTRYKTLVKVNYLQEKVAAAVRKKDSTYFIDLHFSTAESEFLIQEGFALKITLKNGKKISLKATDLLDYYSYFTCCDTFWVAKVGYVIPPGLVSTLAQSDIEKVELELNNKTKSYLLKSRKQDAIASSISCLL